MFHFTKRYKDGCHKNSKKATESNNSRLGLVMKSGKYVIGYKQTLKKGSSKLAIIAVRKSEIEYYAMLAMTGVHHYSEAYISVPKVLKLFDP